MINHMTYDSTQHEHGFYNHNHVLFPTLGARRPRGEFTEGRACTGELGAWPLQRYHGSVAPRRDRWEGALELSESEEDDDEEDDDAEEKGKTKAKPTTREELYKAKHEMLANVRSAEQDILMSLDVVSLLLSKDAKQAQSTRLPSPQGRRTNGIAWNRYMASHARGQSKRNTRRTSCH